MRACPPSNAPRASFHPPLPPAGKPGSAYLSGTSPTTGWDMAEQLLLFASELRARAKEILVLVVSADDRKIRDMRRVIAAGYEKLARRIEQRARETVKA